jgi:tetratricopeptide (TPR) repeat protein
MSWEEREQAAAPLVRGAIDDLRAALAAAPLDAFAHESLGRAHAVLAGLDVRNAPAHLASAVASFSRAVAAAPQSPWPYRALALFAVPQGGPYADLGLRAMRGAVERDPGTLAGLVDALAAQRLGGGQWIAAVPETPTDRLELATLLERRELLVEAMEVYRRAVERAPPELAALARWRLARLLSRQGHGRDALAELEAALKDDAANPELHLERARALAALGEGSALAAYRLAVMNAEVLARRPVQERGLFGALSPRTQAVVSDATSGTPIVRVARYREPLARHLGERRLWAEALEQWNLMAEEVPTSATAQSGRAIALDNLGAREAALEAHRKAVALDAGDLAARQRLAQRLWETDQFYQAINEWRTILARAPGNVEARLSLARAHVRTGNPREATLEYQRLLQIAPDRPEVRQELARVGILGGRR